MYPNTDVHHSVGSVVQRFPSKKSNGVANATPCLILSCATREDPVANPSKPVRVLEMPKCENAMPAAACHPSSANAS